MILTIMFILYLVIGVFVCKEERCMFFRVLIWPLDRWLQKKGRFL